jgi:hypothetical protein
MNLLLSSITLFGFLLSIWIGRISPNGFWRDFPLSLILFGQILVVLKLAGEHGYWISIAFGFAFLNALIVLQGIFEAKWIHEDYNDKSVQKIILLAFASIFVIILVLSAGISEYTKSNTLGFLFGYSLGLVPLLGILKSLKVSGEIARGILFVTACLYSALIGFIASKSVPLECSILMVLIFFISSCCGFMLTNREKT